MDKKNRIFAILNWKKERTESVVKNIVEKLSLTENDKLLIFYRGKDYEDISKYPIETSLGIDFVPISEEDGHNRAAALNFVYKHLKDNFKSAYGYVFYDIMQIKKDPRKFFDAIEEMMAKLQLDIWFNTYTDGCNFVFNKFDGRVSICINEPSLKAIYDKTIIWTSHSNPNLSIIDLDAFEIPSDGKTFDDRFEVPMFWIIKFLCERARDKKGFMNHYPTIADEIDVYKTGDFKGIEPSQETMRKEDELFRSFGLNHAPNQNVEALMDFIVDRLKRK